MFSDTFSEAFFWHALSHKKIPNGTKKVTFLENDTNVCLPDPYLMWCQTKYYQHIELVTR
jgi:hypothetical protein